MGCDNCRILEHDYEELESELDLARISLQNSYVERDFLGRQIARLADYILSLNNGFPVANEKYPDGMGAVDAAIATIEDLRFRINQSEVGDFQRSSK